MEARPMKTKNNAKVIWNKWQDYIAGRVNSFADQI